MPIQLKEKLSRGKIELAIANWFKDKASLQSIFISEPIYVDDTSDRIDVAMFVGGFDVTKMFLSMEKKVREIKDFAIKQGSIKEDEWQAIVKSLVAD
jgi:predicted RNase H-like nuclease